MKAIHSMIVALGFAFVLPAVADAATTDPEVIVYRFPGVRDNGGASGTGGTVFHCTNFSGVTERIRFVTRSDGATMLQNDTTNVGHLETATAATKTHGAYATSLSLPTGSVPQGTTAIAATSINIICTAMTVDASTVTPVGVALRGIRFNPIPGSQE